MRVKHTASPLRWMHMDSGKAGLYRDIEIHQWRVFYLQQCSVSTDGYEDYEMDFSQQGYGKKDGNHEDE